MSGEERETLTSTSRPVQDGVLGALMRRWPMGVALVLLGVAAGLALAWRVPDVYTAETRLNVGSQELSAQAVPGYAAALQSLTSNYARYVQTTDSVREELAASLGPSATSLVQVTASPIPESSILRIEVAATDPRVAVRAADELGTRLTSAVGESTSGPEEEREALVAASQALAEAEQQQQAAQAALDASVAEDGPPGEVEGARQAVVESETAVGVLTVEQEARSSAYRAALEDSGRSTTLSVLREAEVTMDDGTSSLQRLGALGAIAGAGIAVVVALLGDSRARRHRRRAVALVRAHAGQRDLEHDAPARLARWG